MDDLVAFLRALLDERAEKLRRLIASESTTEYLDEKELDGGWDWFGEFGEALTEVVDFKEMLADVAAKRQIIDAFVSADEAGEHAVQSQHEWERARALEEAVEMLALPYAGHEKYQEAWKL